MKKNVLCGLSVSLMVVFGSSLAAVDTHAKIECELQPIVRGGSSEAGDVSSGKGSYRLDGLLESSSTNWSGYAAILNSRNINNTVTAVTGTWIVPALSPTPDNAYSSIWVGIDGYSNGTVEQIGTEQDWINGTQQNYAWFEMYPAGAYLIVGFPVQVGDVITAYVRYMSRNTFQLTIYNNTKRVYAVIPSSYTQSSRALRSSAEWIVEAPSSNTGVLPLAHFNNATFGNCYATISLSTGAINFPFWKHDQLTMVTPTGTVKALPSNLTPNGAGFTVAWEHE